jgi:hypothetical protein
VGGGASCGAAGLPGWLVVLLAPTWIGRRRKPVA